MMKSSKQLRLLVGLGVVWLLILYVQFFADGTDPLPMKSPQSPSTQSSSSDSSPLGTAAVEQLLVNTRESVTFSQPRNIFTPLRFQQARKTAPSTSLPPGLSSSTPPQAPSPSIPSGPSPTDLAAQRARQHLHQYKFLGYLKKGGESQAFLTDGKSIYIVKQGETVAGTIHVDKIDPTSIILSTAVRETGDHVEAAIPLTKEQQG